MMVGERTLSSSLPSDCQVRVFGEKSVGPDHFLSTCMVHEPAGQSASHWHLLPWGGIGQQRRKDSKICCVIPCVLTAWNNVSWHVAGKRLSTAGLKQKDESVSQSCRDLIKILKAISSTSAG